MGVFTKTWGLVDQTKKNWKKSGKKKTKRGGRRKSKR